MSIIYNGFELETTEGKASFSHSVFLDVIKNTSSNQNVDWTDSLGELPWRDLKEAFPDCYHDACALFSLLNMNYQVCNGGIEQYFFNGYHQEREPQSHHDVSRLDQNAQKEIFLDLVEFAKEIYPDRTKENNALEIAAQAFDKLEYEEDAVCYETIYCEEDEYIEDPETGEEIPNPDWFEEYDEEYYENVIHNDNGFDSKYYEANDYIEELAELRAQLCCKQLAREAEKTPDLQPEVLKALKEVLPPSAFAKPSLSAQIQSAASRREGTARDAGAEKVKSADVQR